MKNLIILDIDGVLNIWNEKVTDEELSELNGWESFKRAKIGINKYLELDTKVPEELIESICEIHKDKTNNTDIFYGSSWCDYSELFSEAYNLPILPWFDTDKENVSLIKSNNEWFAGKINSILKDLEDRFLEGGEDYRIIWFDDDFTISPSVKMELENYFSKEHPRVKLSLFSTSIELGVTKNEWLEAIESIK